MQQVGARPIVNIRVVKAILPPLTPNAHKGENGRIGVIGGSLEYTGAPFFAGMAAMKAGADLAHIFCPKEAALPIKSYSPEIIVHPLLCSPPSKDVLDSITCWFPRLHSLVIGPGLGRDPAILQTVRELLQQAMIQQKNLIIDADGLYLIMKEPELISGYAKVILTPNGAEFARLYNTILCRPLDTPLEGNPEEETNTLASRLGGATIIRKGLTDIISNGSTGQWPSVSDRLSTIRFCSSFVNPN